jgi:ubiquinone/menaquinone biosynthesis C-methylase UbiE
MKNEKYVCPSKLSWTLDNFIRKQLHNPYKIFSRFVTKDMIVVDLGCGPGFFEECFADLTGGKGLIIAADLQDEMLEAVRKKIRGKEIEKRILLHKCQTDSIGIDIQVDFVNAFYMVHEVPDSSRLIKEIYKILKSGGIFFLSEPKIHVSKNKFCKTVKLVEDSGFKLIEQPRIYMSRTAVFRKNSQ